MKRRVIALLLVILALGMLCAACSEPTAVDMGGYLYPSYQEYNSPAEENGLGGTKLYVKGVCKSIVTLDATPFAIVEDGENEWMIVLYATENDTEDTYDFLVDEDVCIFGEYLGFSEVKQLPCIMSETFLYNGTSYNTEAIVYEQMLIENEDTETNPTPEASIDSSEPDTNTLDQPTPTPTEDPTAAPDEASGTITLPSTPPPEPLDSSEDVYTLIREYAEKEWPDDSSMADWEYDQQVDAYKYCSSLPDSDIKSYALKEWKDGKYTDWTMVEWEYDQQTSAYNYIQNVDWSGKQAAINDWTEGGYTDWTMVKWEYENR